MGGLSVVPFDRTVIDEIVEGARARLVASYPDAASPRFPFGMHHACTRRQVRLPTSRRHLQQPEIAEKLVEWAKLHGGAPLYAWQSVATAVAELVAESKESPVARDLLTEAETALRTAPPFLSWLKQIAFAEERRAEGEQ
ncbi:hypothetical protein ACVIGB_000116 [Bradyrhizobium sp. USDA 4341]